LFILLLASSTNKAPSNAHKTGPGIVQTGSPK